MRVRSTTLLCTLTLLALRANGQTGLLPAGNITAKEISERLAENNRKRNQALQAYAAQREYHLLYTGFPGRREAHMVVEVKYQAPASKDFTVVSESGSRLIINRVFKKLLDGEKEAAKEKNQTRTALSSDNYDFELLGEEAVGGRTSYVLRVEPKVDNKFLYRGKIWVDAMDYAVAKIEAEPARRPSFWISKTLIRHSYQKVGDFWLPFQNESTTDVRLGGHATLSILYGEYKIITTSRSGASPPPSEPPQESAGYLEVVHPAFFRTDRAIPPAPPARSGVILRPINPTLPDSLNKTEKTPPRRGALRGGTRREPRACCDLIPYKWYRVFTV